MNFFIPHGQCGFNKTFRFILAGLAISIPTVQVKGNELSSPSYDQGSSNSVVDVEAFSVQKATPNLLRYFDLRGSDELTIDDHRKLAKWCEKRGLKPQATAHWNALIGLDPNDLEARRKLNQKLVGTRWLSAQEIADAEAAAKLQLKNLKTWVPKLRSILTQIQANDPNKKTRAIDQLKNIQDPSAINAIELLALQSPDDLSVHLVRTLANFRTDESCAALVNIAVSDIASKAGQTAIDSLKYYPMEFYVPELIESLSSEIQLQSEVFRRPSGEVVRRHVFTQETRDALNTFVVNEIVLVSRQLEIDSYFAPSGDGQFIDRPIPLGTQIDNRNSVIETVRDNANRAEIAKKNLEVEAENLKLDSRRKQVYEFLRTTTGRQLDNQPEAWWAWWDEHNEESRPDEKVEHYAEIDDYRYGEESYASIQVGQPTPPPSYECLVSGTLIQTELGSRPIESLRVGDLVLAQDVQSGTIALKPVLRTTLRPPAKTLRFTTGEETIEATLGHFWWVVDHGWHRTKELEVGMRLLTAKGETSITEIEETEVEAETFNLVVADYHTYFVGVDRILSNDATSIRPTFQTQPGIPAPVLAADFK